MSTFPNKIESINRYVCEPGVYRFAHLGRGVMAGFSGREFDRRRRDEFLERLGADPRQLVMVKQEHTAQIVLADGPGIDESIVADGIVTRRSYLPCAVRTADCVPIFYWDPREKAAGIAHAGWRGIWQGIAGKMVRTMSEAFGSRPADLRLAIGPANRVCCYEVGPEFQAYFPDHYQLPLHAPDAAKAHVDLIAAACADLASAGIAAGQIEDCGICTACHHNRFFSVRKGDGQERIFSVIQISKGA